MLCRSEAVKPGPRPHGLDSGSAADLGQETRDRITTSNPDAGIHEKVKPFPVVDNDSDSPPLPEDLDSGVSQFLSAELAVQDIQGQLWSKTEQLIKVSQNARGLGNIIVESIGHSPHTRNLLLQLSETLSNHLTLARDTLTHVIR